MPPTMTEMQDRIHELGWEIACINSNQPDGSIAWHFVAMRGDQELRVNGLDVHKVWLYACDQAATISHDE